MLGASEAKK